MDTGTRRKILNILKCDGAQAADDLAGALGISAMGARQHLYLLAEEGLVTATPEMGKIGRPRKLWKLSEAADAFFPQGYAELTAGLMAAMQEAFGDKGLEKIVAQRTAEQISQYRKRMNGASSLAERLGRLAEIRTEEGYMAGLSNDGDGFVFVENHCPICAVAKNCTGLCASELELFAAVIGDDAEVERTEHILAGARRCAYRVTPRVCETPPVS